MTAITSTITRGTWVCVTLSDAYQDERPHRPEDGMRGLVTDDAQPGDHPLFVLHQGRARASGFPDAPDPYGFGRLPFGRVYCTDEVEIIEPPA